jgi:hypothetical protein
LKKIILGAIASAAVAVPLALAVAPANAATPVNHGQCVSGAVKAGVTGDAFTAIAKNNALVGVYGSATCPAPAVAPNPDKANSDALTWTLDVGDTHVTGTFVFNVDKDGSGSFHYTASNGNVIDGVVTTGTYQKTGNTAVFAGEIINTNNPDFRANPNGAFVTAKVVDGAPDMVALFANQVVPGTWITSANDADALAATTAYQMGAGTAGIVTAGNLTVF